MLSDRRFALARHRRADGADVREQPIDVARIDRVGGLTDLSALRNGLDERTAVVVVQSPNHLGCIEPLGEVVEAAHQAGALVSRLIW